MCAYPAVDPTLPSRAATVSFSIARAQPRHLQLDRDDLGGEFAAIQYQLDLLDRANPCMDSRIRIPMNSRGFESSPPEDLSADAGRP